LKVTVTGGAGFIGANLCRRLLDRNHDVIVIDDFSTGYRSNLRGLDVRVVAGTILDPDVLRRAVEGSSAIVHLAAVPSVPRSLADPVTSHEANASGTLAVLEAARASRSHVIVASSSSVYGANPAIPKAEWLRPMPASPYAVSKLAAESYATVYQRCFDLPTLAFRFFNVFGPLQAPGHAYAAVVPAFVDAALRGAPLRVHGDGRQTRDFTYVDTVTTAIALAVENRIVSLEPVNLAFGGRYSLLEVIAALEVVFGHKLERIHSDPRAGDVRDSQADATRFQALFPDLQNVSLTAGLEQTVSWMKGMHPNMADGVI
jgi:UDP-glucose 4-epimerase